jgi:hypothetical protein
MSFTHARFLPLFIILSCFEAHAVIIPKENAVLNYTNVYLEEDLQPGATDYELLIYQDTLEPSSRLPTRRNNSLPAFRMSGLAWGKRYHWKISAYNKAHILLHESEFHMFTITSPVACFNNVDKVVVDIKTNKKDKQAGGLVMIDYTRSIYDRDGKAIWTLPEIPGIVGFTTLIRDLKMTVDNTITFLTEKNALEIDLDGNILWKAPYPFVFKNDTIIYHHDLKKTKRGTYMVLGTRGIKRSLPGLYTKEELDKETEISIINNKPYKNTQITVLLEFNDKGKLTWFWDANDYITDADLGHKKYPNGIHNFSSHSNAFSENENGTSVYVGFRDLSRIVKIDKATKKVKSSYGEKYPSGDGRLANNLFRKQHDATITKHNSLLIFNNNDPAEKPGERKVSSVLEIKEKPGSNDSILLWSFALDYNSVAAGWSSGGGNVTELPNNNLLLCAGVLNKIVEVTREKEVVWDARVILRLKGETEWKPFPQYRCSWISELKDYHFIPYVTGSRIHEREISLSIANTGTADDFYRVEVIAWNKSLYKKGTSLLGSGGTLEQTIKLKSIPREVKKLFIIISSANGKFSKILEFNL